MGRSPHLLFPSLAEDKVAVGQESRDWGTEETQQTLAKREGRAMQQPLVSARHPGSGALGRRQQHIARINPRAGRR